ncbi:MAG: methyltransferase domain-containing protein [Lachnospiraceae bacterium]|nr:methyltransferase domain-containing protein [Lachnospiraceae bacterium]
MEAYTGFAEVYDIFMDNVPYEQWSRFLVELLHSYGVEDGLVCELGCGTGKMTELLSEAGFDMIGIDASYEMLSIAQRSRTSDRDILYLCQDMREMELYGTVEAVVSVCDSMNYLLSEEDLFTTFSLVNNYLDPGGLFIFDMNTEYKYRELLGERTICENREMCSFIWENYYDRQERMNEYDLTLFVKEQDDLFRKFEEIHYQRSYSIETVRELLEKSGMEVVDIMDATTHKEVKEDSERVYFIAREIMK